MGVFFALAIIVIGFLAGLFLQKKTSFNSDRTSVFCSKFSLFFLIPFSVLSSLWQLPNITAQLIYLPLIGAAVIGVGIAVGFICRRYYKLTERQFGALLPVTAFYNLGALGNLLVFVTIGENGVALLALFKLCEELIYFGWTFPYTRMLGKPVGEIETSRRRFWRDPIFIVALSAVMLGIFLNQTAIHRPSFFSIMTALTVPMSSFLMIAAVGMTFNVKGGKQWVSVGFVSATLRSLLSLVVVALALTVFDLWTVNQGDVARVCLLLAVVPTAFMSVLPSVLYDLDKTLANTTWFVSFVVAGVVVPLVIYLSGLMI